MLNVEGATREFASPQEPIDQGLLGDPIRPRRGVGRLVMGLVAAVAGMGLAGCHSVGCCTPARMDVYCGGSHGSSASFSCPSGYYRRFWACCSGSAGYSCGECTPSSSCWNGPFACSWWSNHYAC